MTRHHKNKSRAKLLRSLYIWHRYFGISTAVFVIVLTVTGIFLNHTDELKLDAAYVQSDTLLNWYGINAPAGLVSYKAGAVSLTGVNEQIYRDDRLLPQLAAPLAGAVAYGGLLVIASGGTLSLLMPTGELVEKLDNVAGVPTGILAIGITPRNLLAVKTADGIYLTNEDLLEWHRVDAPEVTWSSAIPTAPALQERLQAAYRGTGLPLERIILDLHSGRILGQAGVYIMDAAAIGFLLLAVSGLWLWMRRRASVKAHRQKKKHPATGSN